jgi:hypothetical protein
VSYNSGTAKIYNATGSLDRFKNKKVSFFFKKTLWPYTMLALG